MVGRRPSVVWLQRSIRTWVAIHDVWSLVQNCSNACRRFCRFGVIDQVYSLQADTALGAVPVWFWYTAFLCHWYFTITTPVPIRGYDLQTLLTLPWLPYTSFLPLFFSPSIFPPFPPQLPTLPTPPIYAYIICPGVAMRPLFSLSSSHMP